jgi:hypothetical protein
MYQNIKTGGSSPYMGGNEGMKLMSGAEIFIVMISWLITLALAFWLGWKRGHDAGIRGIVHIYKETQKE